MQAIGYYISLPFLYFISLLPFWLLYKLSDVLYVLLYHIIGYRKEVVFNNLSNAFPEKKSNEIESIASRFYQHLCDVIVETIKTLTISKESSIQRCRFKDPSLLFQLQQQHKNMILVMGHYGNWELGGTEIGAITNYQLYVLYRPLSNRFFNRLMINKRTRLGTKLIAMKDTFKTMVMNRDKDELNITAFIADQTPAPENAYWTNFLNQETPVFWGTEIIAKKMNYPVVYLTMNKVKRGYYEMELTLLSDSPAHTKKGEISEMHTRKLEQDILKEPALWLWSHKRWKHKKPITD